MTAEALFQKYLRILNIKKEPPSISYLEKVLYANITHIPFENISKLYYLKRDGLKSIPELAAYLEGIEKYNLGGTCYSNNHYLNQLLKYLGFEAALCGADMNDPDVHLFNIVKIENREFILDCGYAAPFIRPLPRDLAEDYTVELGSDRYVLHPRDERGYSRIDVYRDNELIHGYTGKPMPRELDYFSESLANSFSTKSNFMNSILLVKFFANHSIAVRNYKFIVNQDTESKISDIADQDDLINKIETNFGIPQKIILPAIDGLDLKRDISH